MFATAIVLGCGLACRSERTPAHTGPSEVPGEPATSATSNSANRPAKGSRVAIETGIFHAGTPPGLFARVPELEPPLSEIELGPFQIDVLPYPGDPDVAPLRVESAQQAASSCAEREGRLCTELEWERACKGDKSQPFSSGKEWRCDGALGCPSSFGVHGLGTQREWTASHFGTGTQYQGKPVMRGADADASIDAHRCAHRGVGSIDGKAAFRCCYGPPNGIKVVEATREAVFKKHPLTKEKLGELLKSHPRTEALAKEELVLFPDPEAARTVIDRGPGDRMGFDFTATPLLWSPVPGARFLAVSGRAGKNEAFVLVYHALGNDRFELASSFLMHDEAGPVVFAYSEGIEPRFHFSTCWGCPGDTGKVLYREPDRAVVLQP